jgi:hypothetical protein
MGNRKIDKKKYGGKYIATKSFSSHKIIASGKDIVRVYEEAVKSGAKDPVIDFIPKEGYVCLY